VANRRPHLLLFNPDQWRGDVLGHLGNPGAVTPNLDALVAADAVSFSSAFCQNPVCVPSRCSFMTGWYPHVAGHRTMYHMLRPHEPHLLKVLRREGWFVCWAGKNDLVPAELGFDGHCDVKYRPATPPSKPDPHQWDEWRGDPASDGWYSFYLGKLDHDPARGAYDDWDWANVHGAIGMIKERPNDRPLCLFLPLGYPHPPYAAEDPFYSMVDPAKVPARVPTITDWRGKPSLLRGIAEGQRLRGWTEDRWRELRRTYYASCARVDHQFGLVVEALKSAGIYDDTLILFFSDHGDFTGDYGLVEKTQNTFEDCLTRVPLVVKPPMGVPVRPRITPALAELVDLTATVYDLTGVSPGYTSFGRSLLPVVAGTTDDHRDAVFCEGGRLDGEAHAAEFDPAKYGPQNLYYPRIVLQARMPEHSKGVMCRTATHKFVARLYEDDELYDLRTDPAELVNRADDPALADVRRSLTDRLLRFFLSTGDHVPHDLNRR
jgi:arylsulfatase A-like enzyme